MNVQTKKFKRNRQRVDCWTVISGSGGLPSSTMVTRRRVRFFFSYQLGCLVNLPTGVFGFLVQDQWLPHETPRKDENGPAHHQAHSKNLVFGLTERLS